LDDLKVSLAEKLAVELLNVIDPTLQFIRKFGEEMDETKEGELILCDDIEAAYPHLAAYFLARDAIWSQRCRDIRPSLEVVTWSELCEGLREAAFAGLAIIYKETYFNDEYVGSAIRHIKGKLAFVMRPANAEEKKQNLDARTKMKMVQAMYDSAHEVAAQMGGGTPKKKNNSWTFH
jgi:hypothetical protein